MMGQSQSGTGTFYQDVGNRSRRKSMNQKTNYGLLPIPKGRSAVTSALGDKSISHRSIMLGLFADGVTEIEGFEGEDALATSTGFPRYGVEYEGPDRVRLP